MRQPFLYKSKLLYFRSAPRRSYKIFFWVALFFLFASGGAYGMYRLAALPYWQIKNISVSGTKSLQENEVRGAVADYLNGVFFGIIPKTNYFFVRVSSLEKLLLEKFPRMRSVQVQKKFSTSLEVRLDERDIWALYCNDSLYAKEKNVAVVSAGASSTSLAEPKDVSKESARSCFYIDDTGDIIDSALEYQGSLLPIFFERRSENPALGESVLSNADILFFNSARDEYKKNIGADIGSLEKTDVLPDDYILFFQDGWFLFMPRSADVSLAAKNIKTLFASIIKDRNRLLYVDARFGNKVFYKLK